MGKNQGAPGRGPTSFAPVSGEPATDAGIELVLGDGCRLRISKGVDGETVRAVLAAVERDANKPFPFDRPEFGCVNDGHRSFAVTRPACQSRSARASEFLRAFGSS